MAKIRNIKQRDQFNFYKSFDDIAQSLTDKQLSAFMRTLLDVQFLRKRYENVKFNDNVLDLLWSACKFNIESQVDGYLANKIKNNDLFIGVYDKENGGSNGGLHQEQLQEQEKEQEKSVKVYEKHSDFSLSKLSSYSNLSSEYKIALQKYLGEYIEDLEMKIINAKSTKKTLSYDDFILGLESSGKKYSNFIATYKTWNRRA